MRAARRTTYCFLCAILASAIAVAAVSQFGLLSA
jgi:hypothetical protein